MDDIPLDAPADADDGRAPVTVAATRLSDAEAGLRTVQGPLTVPNPPAADLPTVSATVGSNTPPPATVAATVLTTAATPAGPPPVAAPRLVVIRGARIAAEYPIYDGRNYVGRSADKPVDIDLNGQEPAEQVWSSRQHAVVTLDRGAVLIEDLNSLNGTFVNRSRLHPGQQRQLQPNDVIQIGTVQFRLVM